MQRENLEDLRAVVAAGHKRSFTKAAAKLGVSQSTLPRGAGAGLEGDVTAADAFRLFRVGPQAVFSAAHKSSVEPSTSSSASSDSNLSVVNSASARGSDCLLLRLVPIRSDSM